MNKAIPLLFLPALVAYVTTILPYLQALHSNPDRSCKFLPSPKYPNRLWGPPSFMFSGYHVSLAEVKGPGREADHLYLIPSLRMSGAIPLLPDAFVSVKVATSPCLFYRFRYLEHPTLWHEWVLELTATTATG
jgi:hypothetical protein